VNAACEVPPAQYGKHYDAGELGEPWPTERCRYGLRAARAKMRRAASQAASFRRSRVTTP